MGADLGHDLEDALHLGALADDVREPAALFQLLLQVLVPQHELAVGEGALDHEREVVEVGRLGEKVVGAAAHRVDGALDRPVPRQDDHGNRGMGGHDALEQLLSGHARHLEVGDDQVDFGGGHDLERVLTVGGERHLVAVELEGLAEAGPDVPLVVDHHDVELHSLSFPSHAMRRRSPWGTGNVSVNVVPSPARELTDTSPECSLMIL